MLFRIIQDAERFYKKLGLRSKGIGKEVFLANNLGLCLCLVRSMMSPPDGKNILMDMPRDSKFPGINHMSFGVPSVSSTLAYLEESGVSIASGTRGSLAIFVRDPSRNTLELSGTTELTTRTTSTNRFSPIRHAGV